MFPAHGPMLKSHLSHWLWNGLPCTDWKARCTPLSLPETNFWRTGNPLMTSSSSMMNIDIRCSGNNIQKISKPKWLHFTRSFDDPKSCCTIMTTCYPGKELQWCKSRSQRTTPISLATVRIAERFSNVIAMLEWKQKKHAITKTECSFCLLPILSLLSWERKCRSICWK